MIRRPLLVLPLVATVACTVTLPRRSRRPPAPAPVVWTSTALRERAKAIDQKAEGLRKIDGTWESRDQSATFTAHVDGSALVLIRERVGTGDYGAATKSYYFADGRLFHYQEDGNQTTFDPPNPPTTEDVLVRILFDPQGGVIEGRKSLNGAAAKLERYEVAEVIRHAEFLRGRATGTRGTRSSGPTRIRFEPGASQTRVTAAVTADRPAEWVLTAKAGQTMRIRVEDGRSGVSFAVSTQDRVLVAEATEWSGVLPRNGDYRIRATRHGRGDTRSASESTLVVEVE